MIETYEYLGLWWLPGDEATKLSGTLSITRGSASLDVLGSFGHEVLDRTETETVLSPLPAGQRRILGISTTGKEVTLEGCAPASSTMNLPGIPTTKYRPRVALLGAWFSEGEEVNFDEVAIRTSDLDAWACVSGIRQAIAGEKQPETRHFAPSAIDIHFEPPPSIPIQLAGGDQARIDFAFRHTGIGPVTTEVSLSQTASLCLRFATPCPLERALESVGQVRNFLSLAVGQPVTVLSVTGFKDALLRPNSSDRQPIQLLWQIPHNPEPSSRRVHPSEMLFTLPEAKPKISEVMQAWFLRQDLFRPVFNLYFGMLYHPDMYSDVHFLAYAQAIETYDFRRRDPYELPPDEHNRRMAEILERAPRLGWPRNRVPFRVVSIGRALMTEPRTVSQLITDEVTSWSGVEAGPGRRGEFAFKVGGREIGHLHGDRAAHFFFPRDVWRRLREQRRIVDHPVFPGKEGPAARRIDGEADVRDVIELLRLNYDRAVARHGLPTTAVTEG